jgi:TRAP-type C4-dicarboxylate transport system permease small subunit
MKLKIILYNINHYLRRIAYPLSRTVNSFGTIVFLLGMMFITTGDVISRYFLNSPIPGAFELVQLMLAGLVFFGLAHTATQKRHIVVEILFVKLPEMAQVIVAVITSLLSIGLFIVTVFGIVDLVQVQWEANTVTSVLEIPIYPVAIAMAFGVALLCLVLLTEMMDCLTEEHWK